MKQILQILIYYDFFDSLYPLPIRYPLSRTPILKRDYKKTSHCFKPREVFYIQIIYPSKITFIARVV